MKVTRRDFLKISGATAATFAITELGFDVAFAAAKVRECRIKNVKGIPTICPYCGAGCGFIAYSVQDQASKKFVELLSVEGDPDHPTNQGGACPKGQALFQIRQTGPKYTDINPKRVLKPGYRAAGSSKWEEKEWDWVLDEIAKRIKETRDKNFTTTQEVDVPVLDAAGKPVLGEDGKPVVEKKTITVNRTEAIANLGGAALDNEECYLQSKMMRALGMVFVEHQARICHSSTVAGLAPSFGRGVMTNAWSDLQNTDVALIMGGNPAENHPISFKWLMKAKEKRNAKIVVVDPRFSRSASLADQYVPMRPGTDLALMGWVIKEILEKELYNKDYVLTHTNGTFLIDDAYSFQDGLFSGYNAEKRSYDNSSWAYKKDAAGKPLKDPTLKDPRCVINIMKEHYKRYTQETVMNVTGCSDKECMNKLFELITSTAAKDKSMVIMYAMGTTQHTVGSQNVRAFAVLQLLLGNMGIPGGGIAAMRGESNVQGSTDMGLLFHLLPGYLGSPDAKADHATLEAYLKKETPPTGFWSNKPKFMISLLKAWFGDKATKENGYCYDYIPKKNPNRSGGYSHIALFEAMYKGDIKGCMIFGGNPAVGGPNANKEIEALSKLEWLVAVDLWETETAAFWKPEAWQKNLVKKTEDIKTEVFLLPACGSYEKEGSIANSGRWIQYRWKGAEPVGESQSDLWIINQIMERVKKLYAGSTDPKDKPIQDLTWNYGHGHEPDLMLVAKEMNGYNIADGKPLSGIGAIKDDGTTASGLWIYAGIMPEEGKYRAKDRDKNDKSGIGLYNNWAFSWPANRRIVYNRASADADGKPWSEAKKLLWWDPTMPVDAKDPNTKIGRWTGLDIPDIGVGTAPNDPSGAGTGGFFMRPENVGCMFSVPSAVGVMNEGPLPEHYEPWESPVNNLLSKQNLNPVVKVWEPDKQSQKDRYPIVGTSFRVTEHWQAGAMTRNLPWLAEIVPDVYVEMSESLAQKKGIKSGDKVIVSNARGEITAYAMVTKRLKPFKANGELVDVIGIPWHFGFSGFAKGDPANRLTPHIGDGNTMIPEYKAWLCDVRRA